MGSALLVVGAITLIVALSSVSSRLGVAAPLLLTVAGITYSFLPGLPRVEISPEVVLEVVLPVLVYASALQTPLTDFRREIRVIISLSVVLVVVSAFAVAVLLMVLLPVISFGVALTLGAVVSPTDSVAATSIAKRLGLPTPIVAVLEGESLVNDASALTLLRTALVAIGGAFSGWRLAGEFGYSVVVAFLIGSVVGGAGIAVRRKLQDTAYDTAISLVLPFLAFVPAQALGASGIVATVAAGLVAGTVGPRYVGARARISERVNWRTVQFVLEGGVFLVMGAQLAPILLRVTSDGTATVGVVASVGVALVVVVVLLVTRAAVVFMLLAGTRREAQRAPQRTQRLRRKLDALDALGPGDGRRTNRAQQAQARRRRIIERRITDLARFRPSDLRWRSGVVATAAGMRGVVTLAAAQSIPEDVPLREQLILIAFVVAVATLLGQGGTLPTIIRLTGVRGSDRAADQQQAALLVGDLTTAALSVLENPGKDRDGRTFEDRVVERIRADVRRRQSKALYGAERSLGVEQVARAQYGELLGRVAQAVQDALTEARSRGEYSSDLIRRAQVFVDHDSSAPEFPTEAR